MISHKIDSHKVMSTSNSAANQRNEELKIPALFSNPSCSVNSAEEIENNTLLSLIKESCKKNSELVAKNKDSGLKAIKCNSEPKLFSPILLQPKIFEATKLSNKEVKDKPRKEYLIAKKLLEKQADSVASNHPSNAASKKSVETELSFESKSHFTTSSIFDKQNQKLNDELNKLREDLGKSKENEAILLKEMETLRGQNNSIKDELNKNLDEMRTLEEKNKALKENLESNSRLHFNEMKSFYEKYILVQSTGDKEKSDLKNEVNSLQDVMKRKTNENEDYILQIKTLKDKFERERASVQLSEKHLEDKLQSILKELQEKVLECEHHLKEKNSAVLKLHEMENYLNDANKSIIEKNLYIQELQMTLNQKESDIKKLNEAQTEQQQSFEKHIQKIKNDLEYEQRKNDNLQSIINEKQENTNQLEEKLQLVEYLKEQSDSAYVSKISSLEYQLKSADLEKLNTVRANEALQKENEYLKIKNGSLQDICKMKNTVIGDSAANDKKLEKLVSLWQQKVYQLMILLKCQKL